jgi:hypothetical protein
MKRETNPKISRGYLIKIIENIFLEKFQIIYRNYKSLRNVEN